MDRVERTRPQAAANSRYANERSVSPGDRRILETGEGRENTQGAEPGALSEDEVRRKDVGAVPRSAVTGRHDPGVGDNEVDGRDPAGEATRRAAEDIPQGGRDFGKPVFDRR